MKDTKLDKINLMYLADLYGALLTQKQQKFFGLFYGGDCSLAEISEQYGVTRQAVRDCVVKAETILQNAEQKLGLYQKLKQINDTATTALSACNNLENSTDSLILALQKIKTLTD